MCCKCTTSSLLRLKMMRMVQSVQPKRCWSLRWRPRSRPCSPMRQSPASWMHTPGRTGRLRDVRYASVTVSLASTHAQRRPRLQGGAGRDLAGTGWDRCCRYHPSYPPVPFTRTITVVVPPVPPVPPPHGSNGPCVRGLPTCLPRPWSPARLVVGLPCDPKLQICSREADRQISARDNDTGRCRRRPLHRR